MGLEKKKKNKKKKKKKKNLVVILTIHTDTKTFSRCMIVILLAI
jgi:hypothetical protein